MASTTRLSLIGTPRARPLEAAASVDNLLADNLQSASQLSTPTVGQLHNVLADDLQSASELSTPTVVDVGSGEDVLTADNLQSAAQLSTPTLAETVQYLVPNADTLIGFGWTTHTGSTSNLYQQIDEQVANDSDYIQSSAPPVASAAKFALSNGSPTPTAADTQRVRYRYGKDCDDGQPMTLNVFLIEGASTVRATWTHTNIPATLTTANQVLTGPQKAAITDYDDLFIHFEADNI